MARNLLFSLRTNKLFINSFNQLSSHKLCKHLSTFSTIQKNLLLNKRKLLLVSSCSALMASLFATQQFVNYYQNNSVFNDNNNDKRFVLRIAQLLSKNEKNEKNENENNSKRYSFNFIADVTEKVSSAVVFIEVKGRHPLAPNAVIPVSSGSGFIVNGEGLVLTNAHVVANYKTVSVKLFDGRVVNGIVECTDERLDLATIRINAKDVPFIKLGDSRSTRPGEWVIAMGSPFSLSNTITVGVVSSINRAGKELGLGLRQSQIDYIQTDASINLGNSGGPLVNLDGEAIGINTMKVTAGISFALPSIYAIDFLEKAEQLRKKRLSSKGKEAVLNKKRYIGITMLTLTPKLIEQFHSRETDFPNVTNGILIWRVVLGSPAHLEGLQPGDIIIKINNQKAISADDIYKALESDSDKPLSLTLKRKDREINLVIKPVIVE